jgi:hypothetical protein
MRRGDIRAMKIHLAIVLAALVLVLSGAPQAEECTTAVISGSATTDGRPLLWKNRDTEDAQNKLVFLNEGPLAAAAMVTPGDSSKVWMGVNEAGLAIENSASDDLEGSSSGENGTFMKYALLHCATVAEFETLLSQTNASGRKTKANYGVIDANGTAAMFEVGNRTFRKYDTANPVDAPLGIIVRTNFAFTGDGSGAGHIRYNRAVELLSGAMLAGRLSHRFLLQVAARDLKNDVIDPYPLPYEGSQDGLPPGYIRTANSINRSTTRSSAVFHGVRAGEDPRLTTMWTILGEPVCSVALPVWPLAGSVPAELGGPSTAPLCDAAIVKKGICYPLASNTGYINTYALDDGQGGGIFSYTRPIDDWCLSRAETLLAGWRLSMPTPLEVSMAQDEMALRAYWCFLASSVPNDSLSEPLNLTCKTFENRTLLVREYVHTLTWRPPAEGLSTGYKIYDISSGSRTLLAELPAASLSYLRRLVDRSKKYIYAVLGVDLTGNEGNPACVESGGTIQTVEAAGKTARLRHLAVRLAVALQ